MKTSQPAVQILETFFEEVAALQLYSNLSQQEGVTHVRLLRPTRSKSGYRVQALMVGEVPAGGASSLPDGMRMVLVDDRVLSLFDEVNNERV